MCLTKHVDGSVDVLCEARRRIVAQNGLWPIYANVRELAKIGEIKGLIMTAKLIRYTMV